MRFVVISGRQILSEHVSEEDAEHAAMMFRRSGWDAYVITYAS